MARIWARCHFQRILKRLRAVFGHIKKTCYASITEHNVSFYVSNLSLFARANAPTKFVTPGILREKAKNETSLLQHKLDTMAATKTPTNPKPEALFEPKRGSETELIRPRPDIRSHIRSEPAFYEPTLSPSSLRKHSGSRPKRHVSSNDETDDSIMHVISKYLEITLILNSMKS